MKVFKLRDKRGFPCVQVATELETTAVDERWVNFLVFTHNPLDRYDRSYASRLAPELFKRGCADGSVPHEPGKVKEAIVRMIAEDSWFPQRAREAARLWLQDQEEIRQLERELDSFDAFLSTKPSHVEVRRYLDFGEASQFEVFVDETAEMTEEDWEKIKSSAAFHLPDLAEVGFDFGPQNGVISLGELIEGIVALIDREFQHVSPTGRIAPISEPVIWNVPPPKTEIGNKIREIYFGGGK